MSSIFRPEIIEKMGIHITEQSLDELEKLLVKECKEIGIPYTRSYLKTIIHTVKRFINIGSAGGHLLHYSGDQIAFVVSIERLLARREKLVEDSMKNTKLE